MFKKVFGVVVLVSFICSQVFAARINRGFLRVPIYSSTKKSSSATSENKITLEDLKRNYQFRRKIDDALWVSSYISHGLSNNRVLLEGSAIVFSVSEGIETDGYRGRGPDRTIYGPFIVKVEIKYIFKELGIPITTANAKKVLDAFVADESMGVYDIGSNMRRYHISIPNSVINCIIELYFYGLVEREWQGSRTIRSGV